MEQRPRALGVMAGAAGIAVAVLTLRPDEWAERFAAWFDVLGAYFFIVTAFAIGVGSVLAWNKWGNPETGSAESDPGTKGTEYSLITQKEFEVEAHRILQDDAPMVVKVFGYTGETVLNDVFRFDDRYRTNLDVRFLHRNWLVEREDEETQNARCPDLRPWRKSENIRRVGTEPWIHPLRRQFRYYAHQPCIKGMIVTKQRTDEKVLFMTFFKWVKNPEEGGSAFKGIDLPFVVVRGTDRQSRLFIDGIESQFDYEWSHSLDPEKVESTTAQVG